MRAIGWTIIIFKAGQRGDSTSAMLLLKTCLPTGLIPLFAIIALKHDLYVRTRLIWVTLSNIFQFYQVGQHYGVLYPSSAVEITLRKALTAVVSSNGTLFLVLTAFMGSHKFRWLFITQYIYALILLLSNLNMCMQSPALRYAYSWMRHTLFIPTLSYFLTPKIIGDIFTSTSTGGSSTGASPAAVAMTIDDQHTNQLDACIWGQALLQLGFGLWVPCVFAYRRELLSRRHYLAHRCKAAFFPSTLDMFVYTMPALVLPWGFVTHFLRG